MIAKNLRWGMGEGGFACGPVGGDILVELMVADDGKSRFILLANPGEGVEIRVGSMPLLDIFSYAADDDFDMESEMEKLESVTLEQHDLLWEEDVPEEVTASRFSDAFKLAFMAMNTYMNSEEELDAEAFLEEYRDEELSEPHLESINMYDEDDWDEE